MAASTTTSRAPAAVSPRSYYSQILAAAENPDFRSIDFVRLVLIQMCIVCLELGEAAEHSSLAFKVGPLVAQIRALRDLAATARLVTEFTIQEDVVNLDGAKFSYVLGRLIQVFRESVTEAGCTPHLWNSICRLMADNLGKAEPEIRRDIKRAHKLPEPEGLPWSPTKTTGS
ncbi:MAG: hypothetical protein LAP86_29180 [Acidobacteriia bacterium]|nr:hypothetical protein [Terriglobia bacterium]